MTLYEAAKEVRAILKDRNGDTIPAIRFLRQKGLSFTTARKVVLELKADEAWWKHAR